MWLSCTYYSREYSQKTSQVESFKFDFQTKEINSYREKTAFEIIDGKLFEQKLYADF